MRIVAVAHVSPHEVTDGYTLRVKRMLETLRACPAVDELSLITPVAAPSTQAARDWAAAAGIGMHEFVPPSLNPFLPVSRERVRQAVDEYLAGRPQHGDTVVLALGIPTGFDLARGTLGAPLVVDIMDEVSVHLKKKIQEALRKLQPRKTLSILSDMAEYRRNVALLRSCAAIVACSPDDIARLRRMNANPRLFPILNGVDVPAMPADVALPPSVAVFHGVLDYPPNLEAALFICGELAPVLADRLPALQLKIMGRRLGAALRDRAARQANVVVLEDVPSVVEHLLSAQIGLYPVFVRTGIQNKILEAWAAGLPIVTTPGIAQSLAGFGADVLSAAFIGESAADFTGHVLALAADPALRVRMGAAGRDIVNRVFRWESAATTLAHVCAESAGAAF